MLSLIEILFHLRQLGVSLDLLVSFLFLWQETDSIFSLLQMTSRAILAKYFANLKKLLLQYHLILSKLLWHLAVADLGKI